MEGYSHSHSHSRSHSTFSGNKKPPLYQTTNNNNVGGFFQTSYDDVFGGPPKYAALAPRAEDYSEIFGAFRSSSSSRASSIPVLDLPAVSDIDSISSSIFDYSEVFGGFHAVDFAVPYDQLFRPPQCGDHHDDDDASSDEAWTPVGTESLSDDSDPFAFSEKSQYFSNGNSHPASDTKQFNVSYHKVNLGTDANMPNMTHVAQLNAVPGYTCVVDESTSSRKVGEESFCSAMVDDIVFSMDTSSTMSQKRTGKTISEMSHDDAGGKSLDSERRHGRAHAAAATMSQVNSASASVSEVNIRTEPSHLPPPSRPPPVPAERKGDIGRMSSGFKASDSCAVNAAVDVRLPQCFDMEVDASSSAAASAAAMKDAMEKAQAKLKAAKVLMDRKRDGHQNTAQSVMKTGENGGVESVKVELDGYASRNDGGPVKVQNPGKERHATTASQTVPETTAGEHPSFVTRKPAERKHKKKHTFSMDNAYIGGDGEWKAATQYYEFVNNDNTRSAPPPSNNVDRNTAALDHHGDDNKCNSDSAEEACVPAENRPKLKVTKAVSRQEYYDKMVKVAQEAHDGVIIEQAEATDKLIGMPEGTHREQNVHLESEPVKNAKKIGKAQRTEEDNADACRKQEADNRSKNTLEKEEVKKKETYKKETVACHREQDDRNSIGSHHSRVKEVPERKEEERRMRGSTERMESETRMQKVIVNEENEKRAKEACERQRKEKKPADVERKKDMERGEVKEERLNDPFEDGFDGGRLQTACESQKNGKTKDLKKVDDKTPKEAFEDVFLEERLQEACRSHDTDKTKDLKRKVQDKTPREAFEDMLTEDRLQGACRNQGNDKTKDLEAKVEHETSREAVGDVFVKERLQGASGSREIDKKKDLPQSLCENNVEGVDVRRSENILPEHFELEECRKHSEAPEQVIRRQRLDEAHKLAADDKKSEDDQSRDENEEKPEKFAEEGTLENKEMQENEVEEAVKILRNNGDLEDQKLLNQRHIKVEWEDEDQGPDSSPGIELPMENGHVMSSDAVNLADKEVIHDALTSKLKKSQTEADGFQDVSSRKDNSEIGAAPSIGESKSKTVGTADVLIDDKQTESTATQIGADDNEQGRRVNASDSLDRIEDDTKSGEVHTRSGQKLKEETKKVTPSVSDPNLEQGGKRRNLEEGLPRDQEQKVKSSPSEGINGWNEHTRKKEAGHNVMLERKESFQKRSQLPNISQTTERKGKVVNQNHSSEEKTKEKERDLESEQLRKLEEEREREREREKDRMAVEFAIREARERAYSDARERAERAALERATDEARQRAMAEARERLEKACAEARERSLADKASEARLKAERAAVERATAEARQRAIEKAMSERATLEARERMQRSISEKFASERDVVMRQSSMPSQSSERFEAADYEPAQRCKARLERHRRTVERVAKALAEKNMRDLLAQREQAERSRLAETLDADIKRWSNGKEGNLRALLSTLQYILGPDSGWQPIPLTEVITAAAVKKAYRKATLCVHPDKLQQRGASIQQKYICEKVFDLLKEAWNRFNSEEK